MQTSNKAKIHQIIQLLRVYNGRLLVIFFLFGRAMSSQKIEWELLFPCVALLAAYGLISLLNYQFDQDIDRINNKSNPYALLSAQEINYVYWASWLALFVFALLSPLWHITLAVCLALVLLGYTYSHPRFHLSYHPLSKLAVMSLIYTVLPSFLGAYPNNNWGVTLQLVSFCMLVSSWFIYSDIRDIRGDLLHNKRTIANTLGIKGAALVSAIIGTVSYFCFLLNTPGISALHWGIAILPSIQWLAVFNTWLISNRTSLVLLNYGLILLCLIWTVEVSF